MKTIQNVVEQVTGSVHLTAQNIADIHGVSAADMVWFFGIIEHCAGVETRWPRHEHDGKLKGVFTCEWTFREEQSKQAFVQKLQTQGDLMLPIKAFNKKYMSALRLRAQEIKRVTGEDILACLNKRVARCT